MVKNDQFWRLSVAPMMDWTHRHMRYFLRLLAPNALLYTEMVTTGALLNNAPHRWLDFSPEELPLALQLGGCEPKELTACVKLAETWGYREVNLNAGCPSDRVQKGRFGACLMKEPQQVADCVTAMKSVTSLPVTVKTRIGLGKDENYAFLQRFIQALDNAGVDAIILHARNAWLEGLSPKQNREIPPLRYPVVAQVKQEFSHLPVILNGGLRDTATVSHQLQHVDGVMIGRPAYQNPYWLVELNHHLFQTPLISRLAIMQAYRPYVIAQLQQGERLQNLIRHTLMLFHGLSGSRQWRRLLSEQAHRPEAGIEVFDQALQAVS